MQHTNIIDWSEDFDGAGRELQTFDFRRDADSKRCFNEDNVKIYCVSEKDIDDEAPFWVVALIFGGAILALILLWVGFKLTACCKKKPSCYRLCKKKGAYD